DGRRERRAGPSVGPDVVPDHGVRVSSRVHRPRTRRGQAGSKVRPREDTMRRVTPYVVGLAAILLLGVSHAVADPSTTHALAAMSLLTGEDQKPPAQKPKAPPPGSPGQAPAQPTAPAAPAKPGMPAPAAGTPAPTPTAPAAAPGPKEPPKPPASPATTITAAPGAASPPAASVEGYSY